MDAEREFMPSASAMPRVFHCHGSVAFSRDAGDPSKPSDEALQGTEIAEALEKMDLEGLDEDSKTIAQRLQEMEAKAFKEWMDDNTYRAQRHVTAYISAREERLWIRDRTTKQKVASAKPDVYYICGDSALVINHKTGYLPIPTASINIQIRTEALALWHEYPKVKLIRACTAHYRFRKAFDACDYTLDDLRKAEQELFWHLRQASQPNAPRVPSEHCRYCPGLHACPQAASYALLPQVHTGSAPLNKQDAQAVAYKLSLEQLAYIVLRFPMLHNFEDAVKAQLQKCDDATLASVGLRRQSTGTIPVCDDWQKMESAVIASGLMTSEQFRAHLKPEIGKIQDVLTEKIAKASNCTKEAATAAAKKIVAPTVIQKPKQSTLKALSTPASVPAEPESPQSNQPNK